MFGTIEKIDLSWVTFTEEDPSEPCMGNSNPRHRPAEAIGALIVVGGCGRHPMCGACLDHNRALPALVVPRRRSLIIDCVYHGESQFRGHNPVRAVGRQALQLGLNVKGD